MIDQLEILFDKQKYLHDYMPKFTDALRDPQATSSIAIFLELLEGGTSDEQLTLLQSIGVPQPIVTLL